MNKILCSTGALIGQPNGRNHKLIYPCSKVLKCDGYEFMFYSTWYNKVDEIVKDIQAMNINIPTYHCEKSIGELISNNEISKAVDFFTINCQIANEFHSKKMVLHLWNGTTSDKHIENNIQIFSTLDSIAQKYNIILTIENVVCNQKDPLTHFIELYERYPNIKFTFDTKMSAFHNQLDKVYSKDFHWLWNEQHIEHLHINDFKGKYLDFSNLKSLHIGEGSIDFNKFFNFLKTVGYHNDYTVESTSFDATGHIDCYKLNHTFKVLKEYIA